MISLNLPTFEYKLEKDSEERILIFDIIRRKYIVLTPEEWVRQHFIHFLINQLNYPRTHFKIETGLKYYKVTKRSDILILDNKGNPLLLIECKAPSVKLTQKTIEQVCIYNKSIDAQFISISNGLNHKILQKTEQGFIELPDFPNWGEINIF